MMNKYTKNSYQLEHHILQIAYEFSQTKKKYKLFRYIDDSYLNILKQDGLQGRFTINIIAAAPHELRTAICNALYRNIILEIYSLFFDNRKDTLSHYVRTLIDSEDPPADFLADYKKINLLVKKYRDKLLAHKATITRRSE